MNYLVQRGKVRGQVINVPEGLPELLSDITREVLRCQPTTECLCQFIIDYLHSVILTREKAALAKKIIDRALRTVDEIISDMCICDISKAKNEEMGSLMEECFKRFLEKRRCEQHKEKEIVKFQEEDMLDELIKKCKFTDKELKLTKPMIDAAYNRFVEAYSSAAENKEGVEELYTYLKDREMQRREEKRRHEAATQIQANFRGFKVRQELFMRREDQHSLQHEASDGSFAVKDHAARTIQKFFKERGSGSQRPSPINMQKPDNVCEPASKISLGVKDVEESKLPTPKISPETSNIQHIHSVHLGTSEIMDEKPTAAAVEEKHSHVQVAETAADTIVVESEEPEPEPEAEPAPAAEPEPGAEPEPAAEEEPPAAAEEPATEAEEPPAAAEE